MLVFEPAQYLLYDVANKKVDKRMKELPKILSGGRRTSPCGTRWHVSTRGDIRIVDPVDPEGVAKVKIADRKLVEIARTTGATAVRAIELDNGIYGGVFDIDE